MQQVVGYRQANICDYLSDSPEDCQFGLSVVIPVILIITVIIVYIVNKVKDSRWN